MRSLRDRTIVPNNRFLRAVLLGDSHAVLSEDQPNPQTEDAMNHMILYLSSAFVCASASFLPIVARASITFPPESVIQVQGQCQERGGPFASQDRAYQVRRQAQSMGYDVSGVFPCYDQGTRGYCFNAFRC